MSAKRVKGGRGMIRCYFLWNNEIKLVEISDETHEQLRLYSWGIGTPIHQIIILIYGLFGEISEQLIVSYINKPGE